jgi:hypothetical protein
MEIARDTHQIDAPSSSLSSHTIVGNPHRIIGFFENLERKLHRPQGGTAQTKTR